MRILFLGHGLKSIPPPARGAVETVIWETARRVEARGHDFSILNVRPRKIPTELPRRLREEGPFDWIWCHHERMVPWVNLWGRVFGARVVHTSHRPVTDVDGLDPYGRTMLKLGARAGHHLCLTHEIMLVNRVLNARSRVAHAPNGVDVASFRLAPEGNGRAICLGGIGPRKRQVEVAAATRGTAVPVDFVGPLDKDDPVTTGFAREPGYLGEWSREVIARTLTEYSALVLFSRAEAQPLVVGEAFAAGLSVVLSEESARNVDTSLPFVHLVRTAEEIPAALARAVAENTALRPAIRAHAQVAWDWDPLVDRALATLAEWSTR